MQSALWRRCIDCPVGLLLHESRVNDLVDVVLSSQCAVSLHHHPAALWVLTTPTLWDKKFGDGDNGGVSQLYNLGLFILICVERKWWFCAVIQLGGRKLLHMEPKNCLEQLCGSFLWQWIIYVIKLSVRLVNTVYRLTGDCSLSESNRMRYVCCQAGQLERIGDVVDMIRPDVIVDNVVSAVGFACMIRRCRG